MPGFSDSFGENFSQNCHQEFILLIVLSLFSMLNDGADARQEDVSQSEFSDF